MSDFSLTVTVTTEEDGTSATSTAILNVDVTEDASAVVETDPTEGDDNLIGTSGDDTIDGLGGSDMIYGGEGEDTLAGGPGSDYLSGGDDDDELIYSADGTMTSGDAALNVDTGEVVDLDGYNASEDVFDGGAGADVLSLSVGNDAIFLDDRYSVFPDGEGARIINVETINAGAGNDLVNLTSDIYGYGDVTINGEDGDDVIWAAAGSDILSGGDGNDMLYGGAGDDYLSGGAGDDILMGGTGSNTLDGGSGTDTVDYSATGVSVKVSLKDDYGEDDDGSSFYDDLSNIENVTGSAFDDNIKGDTGDNTLIGGAGDDELKGESGADMLFGGDGADTVRGGSGADQLYGGAGNDTLKGDGGSDFIYGGEGDDTIDGGGGNDYIVGGAGADTLKGGKGDDTFRFESLDDLGDTITDYKAGDDELSFDSDAFNVSFDATTGMLDASEFEEIDSSAGETASGDAAFVFDTSTDELYYDQSGSGQGYTLVVNVEDGNIDASEIKIE
ncbi:MAG: calcium-binding protein [Alphaproteobacteria bacterium]|nr:calcium-binding protein [Alphaproteobacteria bacterium]